jgi:hypothetical protein
MPVTFDPSTDFEDVVDGLEAVTLLRTGSASTAIANALQRAVEDTEIAASEGAVRAGDVRWHFPTVEAGTTPRMGDVILDSAGDRYTILAVQDATLERRFRCIGRNLRVVYRLDDTVSILQASWTKGRGGAMEPDHWDTWKAGIRARIQPIESNIGEEYRARRTVRQVEILIEVDIEPDLPINQQHHVLASDGTIYKITGFTGAEQIGDVPRILAEETPWPLS